MEKIFSVNLMELDGNKNQMKKYGSIAKELIIKRSRIINNFHKLNSSK